MLQTPAKPPSLDRGSEDQTQPESEPAIAAFDSISAANSTEKPSERVLEKQAQTAQIEAQADVDPVPEDDSTSTADSEETDAGSVDDPADSPPITPPEQTAQEPEAVTEADLTDSTTAADSTEIREAKPLERLLEKHPQAQDDTKPVPNDNTEPIESKPLEQILSFPTLQVWHSGLCEEVIRREG